VVPVSFGVPVRRLNWGCGPCAAAGWINSDIRAGDDIDLPCDIREGLPVASNFFDYIVTIHALQDLPYLDVLPALGELHRVLKPRGVLRIGVPDLDRAIAAYLGRDTRYFYVPDADAATPGAKLVTQIIWYGSVRTPFTFEFADEWLRKAGFGDVVRCAYKQTKSPYTDIVALDNRERETLFIEAVK